MSQAGSLEGVSDSPGPSKKAKRECKYQQEWQSHGMLPSARGPTFARCKCCNTDINIAHGGVMSLIMCPSFDHEIPLFKAHCPPYFSFGVGTYVILKGFTGGVE